MIWAVHVAWCGERVERCGLCMLHVAARQWKDVHRILISKTEVKGPFGGWIICDFCDFCVFGCYRLSFFGQKSFFNNYITDDKAKVDNYFG
jgi:hypothetical protein